MTPRSLLVAVLLLVAGCVETDPLPPGPCGNGVRNDGEECDDGILNSDLAADACRRDCTRARCGDGIIDSREECDGDNLADRTCETFGFDGGTLLCDPETCEYIDQHCSTCGNGLAEGFEPCDGPDLAGTACTDLGFTGGTLGCLPACAFDRSGCTGGCGNGLLEPGEACDLSDLGGLACTDLGFTGGTLGCLPACDLDRSGCTGGCGNGVVEPGEACDDGNDDPADGCADCRAGDGTFIADPPVATGPYPVALRLADLDGDGWMDAVVGFVGDATDGGGVAVHLGDGAGGFAAPLVTRLGTRVSALAVADLDGDGRLDVAVTWQGPAGTPDDPGGVAILPGLGDGTFDASRIVPPLGGLRPVAVEALDLDGQAGQDLAVLYLGSSSVTTFLDQGGGAFAAMANFYSYGWPTHLAAADLNGDGLADLLVSRETSSTLGVFLGIGNGNFAAGSSRYAGARPMGLAAVRVDGNETLDVIVALAGEGHVATLGGDGMGGLGFPLVSAVGATPIALVAERLDADPAVDLAVIDADHGTVLILLGSGIGDFQPGSAVEVGAAPAAIRAADLDQDGILDLVVPCTFSHDLWVLRGNELVL